MMAIVSVESTSHVVSLLIMHSARCSIRIHTYNATFFDTSQVPTQAALALPPWCLWAHTLLFLLGHLKFRSRMRSSALQQGVIPPGFRLNANVVIVRAIAEL